jgi:hypothetical protein
MRAMADTDELAAVRAHVKKLERRLATATGDVDRQERLLVARMLVLIATVALFLTMFLSWYQDIDIDEEDVESASGWLVLTALAGSDEGGLVFASAYSWIVLLATFVAGLSVFQLRRRWVAITLCVLLVLLAGGQTLLNASADDGEQGAGVWAAIIFMVANAFAWGNLVTPLRELETTSLYPSGRG